MSLASSSRPLDRVYYFHATRNPEIIKSILQSKHIEPRHDQVYEGAFVSTRPELTYGHYVLGFNRTIESTSDVVTGEADNMFDFPLHWAGFSKAIPVTSKTLEFVAVFDKSVSERNQLAAEFSRIAGRTIEVVSGDTVMAEIQKRSQEEGVCIPKGWPTSLPRDAYYWDRD
jgi:hypothetical protein